jgi:nicotinamide-nucleotide amidase
MANMEFSLNELVQGIIELLARRQERLVLAESCTAGLAASKLGQFPGISQHWCGSFVTYRDLAKVEWLGVSPELIDRFTSVSAQVTRQMVLQALSKTPEANWAAAITGHLGPEAPAELDGQVYIAVGHRQLLPQLIPVHSFRLEAVSRLERQEQAVQYLFVELRIALETMQVQ